QRAGHDGRDLVEAAEQPRPPRRVEHGVTAPVLDHQPSRWLVAEWRRDAQPAQEQQLVREPRLLADRETAFLEGMRERRNAIVPAFRVERPILRKLDARARGRLDVI